MNKSFILFACVALTIQTWAQSQGLQIGKILKRDKAEPFEAIQAKVKAIGMDIKVRDQFGVVKNNELISLIKLEMADQLKAGKTSDYAELIYCMGEPLTDNQIIVPLSSIKASTFKNTGFSFSTSYAFLGESNQDFFMTVNDIKGSIKKGDSFNYKNDKGQSANGTITKIDFEGFELDYLPAMLSEGKSINITVKTDKPYDLSKSKIMSGAPQASNSGPESKKSERKINAKTIAVNKVLQSKDFKITIHNIVKYKPEPSATEPDIIKIDYDLDYYIFDCSIENTSAKALDAGELLLRFNFFDSNGQSADEFLRVFKAGKNEKDQTKKDANALDKMVFGGSSKLRSAGVMAKYTMAMADWDKTHKAACDAINKDIAPGKSQRCIAATIAAVPASYKIEGIGTWQGLAFDKKKLVFLPWAP